METKIKQVGAVLGATVLAGTSTLAIAPAALADGLQAPSTCAVEIATGADLEIAKPARDVRGAFSYTQDAITDNTLIKDVFVKAASSLCTSIPKYCVSDASALAISGPRSFETTVDELTQESGEESVVMGCACASNGPGGGAMVNADVSGVPVAVLAAIAGVQ